eukprot:13506843-Alexandrium_andersonii.AAC.1
MAGTVPLTPSQSGGWVAPLCGRAQTGKRVQCWPGHLNSDVGQGCLGGLLDRMGRRDEGAQRRLDGAGDIDE